jgi:membrane protease YdiL (CAAX protease family)
MIEEHSNAMTKPEPSRSSSPGRDPTRLKLQYLLLAATVAAVLQIPFTIALLPAADRAGSSLANSAANAAGTILLSYVMIRLGLRASSRVGFGALMLSGWDDGASRPALARRTLVLASGIGVIVGVGVLVGMGLVSPYLPAGNVEDPAPWKGLLASMSAGINEEILFRLGLMTSLAWLLTVLARRVTAGPIIAGVANVLAALAFAAMHLPQAKAFYGLSTLMILVVMVGNGVPGVVFGWLFRRFGLVSAMVAHFSADVVLHVVGPMIG